MKVIIFGTRDLAQLAKFYLESDTEHEVVAFTAHSAYLPESKSYLDLPVIPFEDLETSYPPKKYSLFAPITGQNLNKFREKIYLDGKKKGYDFVSYVSTRATVLTDSIGENCFILEDNTIQPYVQIGNNIVAWSGNHFGHHSIIKDHVFVTSHVVISGHCKIDSYSWFGVNSTIADGTYIAEGTVVAMGSVITKDTDAYGLYMGVPGKKQAKSSLDVKL